MFPSYLFVRARNQWSHLLSTYGVAGIVLFVEEPAKVPFSEIKRLRAMRDRKGIIQLPKKPEVVKYKFQFNEKIFVKDGPFVDQKGWYQGSTAEQRVMVLLNLFGRKTPVSLDEQQISSAA